MPPGPGPVSPAKVKDENERLKLKVEAEQTRLKAEEDAKWNDDGANEEEDKAFEPSFWKTEAALISLVFIVVVVDVCACWLIYDAVETNDRASGT